MQPCFSWDAETSLQARYEIRSPQVQLDLRSNATVELTLTNPFTLKLEFGDALCHELELPLPLEHSRNESKVARKSQWVEYRASVAEPALLAPRPDSVFPVLRDIQSSPVLEHLHYVSPQCLPKLYAGTSTSGTRWLLDCTSLVASQSTAETMMKQNAWAGKITDQPGRLSIKDSIELMYGNIFGLNGKHNASMFSLNSSAREIAKIFVDVVRMDISNQTVFLDAAVFPTHSKNSTEINRHMLNAISNHITVSHMADELEAPFWIRLPQLQIARRLARQSALLCKPDYALQRSIAIR